MPSNRVAIVTGAATSMGKACALKLEQESGLATFTL